MAGTEHGGDWETAGESFVPALMFVVLTLALVVATAACLVVAGLAIALWAPALISSFPGPPSPGRAAALAALIAAPLLVIWLLHRAWRALGRARSGRCADYMLAALAAALALDAFLLGAAPWSAL